MPATPYFAITTMMNWFRHSTHYWGTLLVLLTVLASCRHEEKANEQPPSAEELRLARTGHIDSTLSCRILSANNEADRLALDTLSAESWLLIDDATGFVISQKNANQRMYMASLTKIMTCLLALEHGNMGDTIIIGKGDLVTRDSRVRPDDSYTLRHLLYEMMLVSDNDAAYAVARHISGDSTAFYQLMNEKAAYLGMSNTHFANPNGMPNDSNYSTAADLARLVRYSLADTAFAGIVRTAEMDIPLLDGRHLPCHNSNALLDSYEGCIGVKTGFTRKAGCCLASAATRHDVTLILILLKSNSMAARFTESATLLDYGFHVAETLRRKIHL